MASIYTSGQYLEMNRTWHTEDSPWKVEQIRRLIQRNAIDVFEHVPDCLGFLKKCGEKAEYKIYHVPLDIHVSSVLRNAFIRSRYTIGHLHYFTADSALATLKDSGHEILDYAYTNAAMELFTKHPSIKRAVATVPRWLGSKLSVRFTARLLGGYSLLVLAK